MLQIYNIFIDIAEVSVWANIATLSAKENSWSLYLSQHLKTSVLFFASLWSENHYLALIFIFMSAG